MSAEASRADLTLQSIALQVPSLQRYWPESQGFMIWMLRVTLAFLLGMDKSKTMKVTVNVVPTGWDVFTAHDLMPCSVNL